MLSEVFLTFAVTSFIGCILGIANLCYRSKCEEVGLCCFTIKRNIAAEEHEDIEAMRMKSNGDCSANGTFGSVKV